MVGKEFDWGPDVGKEVLPVEDIQTFMIRLPSFQRQAGRFISDVRETLVRAYVQKNKEENFQQNDVKTKLMEELDIYKDAHDYYGERAFILNILSGNLFTKIFEGEVDLNLRTIAYIANALDLDVEFKLVKREK